MKKSLEIQAAAEASLALPQKRAIEGDDAVKHCHFIIYYLTFRFIAPKSAAVKKIKVSDTKEKPQRETGPDVDKSNVSAAALQLLSPTPTKKNPSKATKVSTTTSKKSASDAEDAQPCLNAKELNLDQGGGDRVTAVAGVDEQGSLSQSKRNSLDITQLFADSLLTEEDKSIIISFNEAIQTNTKLLNISTEPDNTRKFKLQEIIKVIITNFNHACVT